MNERTRGATCALVVCAVVAACSSPEAPPVPAEGATAAVPAASAAAPAPASAAVPAGPASRALVRRATPQALLEKLDAGCAAGDKAACRALADRYRGTGSSAGCGVARDRRYPTLKVTPGDRAADSEPHRRAKSRGCTLGDNDACSEYEARRGEAPFSKEPKWKKPPADGKLPAEVAKLAIDACAATHDCDDLYPVLDRFGYSPAELAPVRAAFAQTLTEACLDGECTCGNATRYLPEDDARFPDLGILGCQNGEAEGCYALGRAYETGRGVEKDEKKARELYDVACPALRPAGIDAAAGEYSPRACDRLSQLALGGGYPGKDRTMAKHYALSACRDPGRELDHAPCVRLAMLWATRPVSAGPGTNAHEARMVANGEFGYGASRPYNDDCRRPSVARECAELNEALKKAK